MTVPHHPLESHLSRRAFRLYAQLLAAGVTPDEALQAAVELDRKPARNPRPTNRLTATLGRALMWAWRKTPTKGDSHE